MIAINPALCLFFLFLLVKAANYAIKFSSRIARILRFQEFIVSFFIVAFISILPESSILIISSFKGESVFGMGALLGSNIADLSLIFGLVALFSLRGVKVKSRILQDNFIYLILLLFPLLLGFDGAFSRTDGALLMLVGVLFYIKLYKESKKFTRKFKQKERYPLIFSIIFLVLSMAVILISAYFTIVYATNFANEVGIPPVIIGLTLVAIGTCLPEFVFSLRAVRTNHDSLALGDLLGTVITDSTIILGLVAFINPFNFSPLIIFSLGGALFLAGVFVFTFMRTGRKLSKIEGIILIFFYISYLIFEFLINNYFVR